MNKKRVNNSQLAKEILAEHKGLDVVKCELCGEIEKIQIHHIDSTPTNSKIANLILLCQKCHHKAHSGCFGKNKDNSVGGIRKRKARSSEAQKKWREKNPEKMEKYRKKRLQLNSRKTKDI